MEKIDDEGRMQSKLCKVEEREPENNWQNSFYLARLKGLSPQVKSFNFKLLHQILPLKERLSQILPATSPACPLCRTHEPESIMHALFNCEKNSEAAQYMLQLTRVYDSTISMDKITRLQLNTEVLHELPTLLAVCTSLELIWRNRQLKKSTRLYDIRAELESQVLALRKARSKKLRETGNIIHNTLHNFPPS